MIRKQLYLPEDLDLELKLLAHRQAKPTAEIVRTAIRTGLTHMKKKKKSAGDMLLELASMGGKGPRDLSANFFDYAYGKKSSYARRNK